MDREQELRKTIWEYEQMYEKRKNKLVIKTWVAISIVFYVAAFILEMMQKPVDYLTGIVAAIVGSGIFLYVAILAITPLLNLREDEIRTLTRLKIELENIEKGQP